MTLPKAEDMQSLANEAFEPPELVDGIKKTSLDAIRGYIQAHHVGRLPEPPAPVNSKSDTAEAVGREVKALMVCTNELMPLNAAARSRVLLYLARRYG